ncbi:MAG: hypothetical protein GX879_00315, partial [Bacteroidales bacterium]|nr:hypothetical protein [Bacteroidales bacterium]
LLLASLLYSCQNEPVASFTTDKAEYKAGENIVFTNTSSHAHYYEWTLPGGQIVNEENPSYKIADTLAGIIVFKLTAFSKDKKMSNTATKAINIIPKTGNAVFWHSEGHDNIIVIINGQLENIINKIDYEPTCGDIECANFKDLVKGTQHYTANDGTYYWEGNIVIEENECTVTKLNFSDASVMESQGENKEETSIVGKWHTSDHNASASDTIHFTENMSVEDYFVSGQNNNYYYTYSLTENIIEITAHYSESYKVSESFEYVLDGNSLLIKAFSNPFSLSLEVRTDVHFTRLD